MNKRYITSLSILLILVAGLLVTKKLFYQQTMIRYPNFGIDIPAGYTTHGIDVSRYQKDINWELVSQMEDKGQRISFAIIKATEGTNLTDPFFKKNWNEIEPHNLVRGAYLYFHPNKSGEAQANYFISKVNLEKGDLPPVIDIEEVNGTSNANLQKNLQECLTVLEKKYDVKPIIYTSVDFYKNHIGEEFDNYPLWAAHYEQANKPRIERDWLLWQHNCKGHVNGIDAEVDFNVVNGSIFALHEICL